MRDINLFTGDSVSKSHPGKIRDWISDGIADFSFRGAPRVDIDPRRIRAGLETLITTSQVVTPSENETPDARCDFYALPREKN
jgi:S-adenosylmethionine synthetase